MPGRTDLLNHVPPRPSPAESPAGRPPYEAADALLEQVPEVVITVGSAGGFHAARGAGKISVPAAARDRRGLDRRNELSRLRSPIGLDLGARTSEETAVSIAAEIIAARHGGTGIPLTDSGRPIHREGRTNGTERAA